jgi:hypothetical protein
MRGKKVPGKNIKNIFAFGRSNTEEAYRETGIFNLDMDRYADLMAHMAYDEK